MVSLPEREGCPPRSGPCIYPGTLGENSEQMKLPSVIVMLLIVPLVQVTPFPELCIIMMPLSERVTHVPGTDFPYTQFLHSVSMCFAPLSVEFLLP